MEGLALPFANPQTYLPQTMKRTSTSLSQDCKSQHNNRHLVVHLNIESNTFNSALKSSWLIFKVKLTRSLLYVQFHYLDLKLNSWIEYKAVCGQSYIKQNISHLSSLCPLSVRLREPHWKQCEMEISDWRPYIKNS